VAAATGLDMERGDQLAVEAFPFEATLTAEPLTAAAPASPAPSPTNLPPWLQKLIGQQNVLALGAIGGVAVVVLGAGFFFLVRRGPRKPILAEAGGTIAGGKGAANVAGQIEAQLAEQAAEHARKEAEALASLKVTEISTKKTEVLTKHISEEAKTNPTGMAHVVRSWLNGEYQR